MYSERSTSLNIVVWCSDSYYNNAIHAIQDGSDACAANGSTVTKGHFQAFANATSAWIKAVDAGKYAYLRGGTYAAFNDYHEVTVSAGGTIYSWTGHANGTGIAWKIE